MKFTLRRSVNAAAALIFLNMPGLGAGNLLAQGMLRDSRIPTISDVPSEFIGTWDWGGQRHSCGSTRDSYGAAPTLGENRPLCQWPIEQIEKVMNGRGRAWQRFANGDDALSPRWTCQAASLGTVLTEGYLRNFSTRPDALVMNFEQSNWIRYIWMDGRKHPPASDSFSHGHSIGWMEDDVLVVETANFTWDPDGFDDQSHIARSHMAKYIERYKLLEPDKMEIAITVDDPLFLKEPYTYTATLNRTKETLVGSWDCDPEAAVRELYQTFRNPYPDDTTGSRLEVEP